MHARQPFPTLTNLSSHVTLRLREINPRSLLHLTPFMFYHAADYLFYSCIKHRQFTRMFKFKRSYVYSKAAYV